MWLYGEVAYTTSSIITGVFSNMPGRVPYSFSSVSPVFQTHACRRRVTFDALISVSVE